MACILMAHDLETDLRNFRYVLKTPFPISVVRTKEKSRKNI
jgi:hypothetical protein